LATIYDVAKLASVAPKTVARALNGDGPVKKETRERIAEAVRIVGYVPSQAARSMRSNKSGLVGLITGAISGTPDDFASMGLPDIYIVQGVQRALTESDLTLLISDTGGRLDRAPALLRTFQEHRVEGLIYVAPHHQKVALPDTLGALPVVLVNCFDDAGTAAVVPDDEAGQYTLVAKLIAFGHRRIAYLTLKQDMVAHKLRLTGYKRALRAAGIAYDPALVTLGEGEGERETSVLADGIGHLFALKHRPSVLCCGNDRLALKVYGMLRSRGCRVPDDVGVAGYDDHQMISKTLFPPLTTAELPYAAMGARAAEVLLGLIKGNKRESASLAIKVGGAVKWRQSVLSLEAKVKTLKGA